MSMHCFSKKLFWIITVDFINFDFLPFESGQPLATQLQDPDWETWLPEKKVRIFEITENELCHQKNCLRCFVPGPRQTQGCIGRGIVLSM